jgi:DNA anti-recombination protein RmuC
VEGLAAKWFRIHVNKNKKRIEKATTGLNDAMKAFDDCMVRETKKAKFLKIASQEEKEDLQMLKTGPFRAERAKLAKLVYNINEFRVHAAGHFGAG